MNRNGDGDSATRRDYWRTNKNRDAVKLRVVWEPYHTFIKKLVPLKGRTLLDFGSGIESPVAKRFLADNGSLSGYFAYDVDRQAANKWDSEGRYYSFFTDDQKVGAFDFVYADNSYEHLTLDQREEFIKRSGELLQPRGQLVLVYPHIANMNLIEHFERDRTHMMVTREHEAGFINSMGYSTQLYIAGLTFPYKPILFSVKQLLRNLLLGYYPQTMVIIVASKASHGPAAGGS